MDRREKSPRRVRLNTMQIVALGFFGVIFLGGVILWLPICNQKPIEFIDALFTSVTSVCVTGLVTVVPAEQYTLFGQVVVMILIQIGGLGVIACMALFFPSAGEKDINEGQDPDPGGLWPGYAVGTCEVYYTHCERNIHSRRESAQCFFHLSLYRSSDWRKASGTAFSIPSQDSVMRESILSETAVL